MDRETARVKSAQLEAGVNKAYDDLKAGRITEAKFNKVCDDATAESERIDVAFKTRQAANKYYRGPTRCAAAGPARRVCRPRVPRRSPSTPSR